MYYWIQNSEDGISVKEFTHDELLRWITDTTSEEVLPQYRTQFVENPPNEYSDTNLACIIKGEVVFPKAVQTVTQWEI